MNNEESSLYDISSTLLNVIERGLVLDDETGEILFDSDDIDGLAMKMADKLEAIQAVSSQKQERARYLREEAKRLNAMASTLEKSAKSLNGYALKCVQQMPGGKVETDHYVIGTRKSTAVEVLDEAKVPDDFKIEKITYSVDKKKVKQAIKDGDAVPGCALVTNVNLQVR